MELFVFYIVKKELVIVPQLVGLLVCDQTYTKATEWISTKFGGWVRLNLE